MCYNVLCDKYATRQLYGYCPSWALNWEYRKKGIMEEITNCDADIISLQVNGGGGTSLSATFICHETLTSPSVVISNFKKIPWMKSFWNWWNFLITFHSSASFPRALLVALLGCITYTKCYINPSVRPRSPNDRARMIHSEQCQFQQNEADLLSCSVSSVL